MKRLELYTATMKKDGEKSSINVAAASYQEAAYMANEWADAEGGTLIFILKRHNAVIIPDEL